MIIRQNPLLSCDGDEESRHICSHIARNSIDAIAAFAAAYPRCRSSGYFLSTALVECIYHLVYILQDSALQIDRPAVLDSFQKAYQLLSDFASTWITAKRALHALSAAIFSGGDVTALYKAITRRHREGSEQFHSMSRDGTLGIEMGVSPDTSLAAFLFNPVPEFDAAGSLSFLGPTMSQLSAQILQSDHQATAKPSTSTARNSEYISASGSSINLNCAPIFTNP
jgi:hypothetical protein